MNIFLSLLIFNPLEALVLFWAAIGDKSKVFRKENIIHFYILGTINFVFQYLIGNLEPSIINLMIEYLYSIIIASFILKFYILYFIKINVKLIKCFSSIIFTIVTTMFVVIILSNLTKIELITIPNIFIETIVNFIIKILQFLLLLLLLLFFGGLYEKGKNFKQN